MTNWNSKSALEWEWEKLAGFSPKAVDILKQGQPSNSHIEGDVGVDNGCVYSSGGGAFSSCDLGHASSSKSSFSASAGSVLEEGVKKRVAVGEFRKGFIVEKKDLSRVDISGNISCFGASQSSGEPTIGLKLGKRTYFEGFCAASSAKAPSISVAPTRISSKPSHQSAQTPHCQVEGCNLDLNLAKDYHRRNRICEIHSKSPKVIVAGMERRFCQQCSRFHELSEFDDKKRSCRRRLSDHNARRRRPQPETIQIDCSSRMYSSLLCDKRQQRNLVVNRVPSSNANPIWQSSSSFKVTQGGGSYTRPAKMEGFDRLLDFPTREMVNAPSSIVQTDPCTIEGLGTFAFDPGLDVAPDFGGVLSLLSPNSDNTMGLNNSEANSVEMQLMQVNQTSRSSSSSSSSSSSVAVQAEAEAEAEAAMVHYSLNNFLNDMIDNISVIPLQEFQLLKAPYNEPACSFYSNQITSTTAEAAASCKSSFG